MITTYIVFRIGSNGANQPMQQEMAIASIEAPTLIKARIIVSEKYSGKCYNNQHLEVRNSRFVPAEVLTELQERLALEAA